MAIAFARIEYVKRSAGKNACCKAAYNKRDKIKDAQTGIVYSFKNRGGNVHHEILLPEGANLKFSDAEVLWNMVEKFENRKNSQVAKELILALPGDKVITHEDRLELTRRFVKEFFVNHGLIVQIDIHAPHKEIDKGFTEEIDEDLHEKIDKNWHAHVLVLTRLLLADGETLSPTKARHLDAQVRKGMVVEGELWGKLWKDLQNAYFKEMGYALRVDEVGIIAQKHLGPVRMRRHMNERQQELDLLKEANEGISVIPEHILDHLAKTNSVFEEREIDAYLEKHVSDEKKREEIKGEILGCEELVPLYEKDSLETLKASKSLEDEEALEDKNEKSIFYTTKKVREEEERTLRHAYRVQEKGALALYEGSAAKEFKFSQEQREAFQYVLQGDSGIKIIEGRAGTGKSYLMQGIREAYEREGISVFGLAPTHLVTKDLEKGGFKNSYTVQGFLFQYINSRVSVPSRSLFMVDEAAMVSNPALGELLKVARETSSKIIFFGDSRQLHAIGRGGLFSHLADTFGSCELRSVRRQTISWQKEISERFSQGDVREALTLLRAHQGIFWDSTKEESISRLIEDWCRGEEADYEKSLEKGMREDKNSSSQKIRMILAHRNIDVDVLNQGIHRARQAAGRVSKEEFLVDGDRGRIGFGVGDRVQFGSTDKTLKIYSGSFGTLIEARIDQFVVENDLGERIIFNPGDYSGLRLGYASTIYKAQGKTVRDAYILHSPRINKNLGYVALTRQTENLRFYVTTQETRSFWHLQKQLAEEDLKRCSLEFKTEEVSQEKDLEKPTFFQKHIVDRYDHLRTRVSDRNYQNEDFYTFHLKEEKLLRDVIQQDVREKWKQEDAEERTFLKSPEKKEKYRVPETEEGAFEKTQESSSFKKPSYDVEKIRDLLLKDVKRFGEHLLGSVDPKLSTSQQLCFRKPKEYKIFLNIEKGVWKDFINDQGGNLFDLIMWKRGGDFVDALEYAAHYTGEGVRGKDSLLEDHKSKNSSARHPANQDSQNLVSQKEDKDPQDMDLKIQKTKDLYTRSEPLQGTLGERYLREHRGIKGGLPQDLRFTDSFYNSELKTNIPALLAFTRDKEGDLRAFQVTYLDPDTARKAKVELPKKTHGKVSGSYVEIQRGKGPTYMAEGVETALSLREAGVRGIILASLGIQNIKKYEGRVGDEEKTIIIAADHDGENSRTASVIEKTSILLKEKGYTVQIIQPEIEGQDFNDVLKKEGKERVFEYFKETLDPKIQETTREQNVPEKSNERHKAFSDPHSLSSKTPEILFKENTQKDSRSLISESHSLEALSKVYEKKVKALFKDKVGEGYKDHLPEIKAIALRVVHEKAMNPQYQEKDLNALFGKAQYELHRLEELKERSIKKDTIYWTRYALESRLLSHIEGNLYLEKRLGKEILSKKDFKEIQKEGQRVLEENANYLKTYQDQYQEKGFGLDQSKFMAQAQLLHEVAYNKKLDGQSLERFSKISEEGYDRSLDYQKEYAFKVDQKDLTKELRQEIREVSCYRAHQEIQSLASLSPSMSYTLTQLKNTQTQVQKEFRKEHYHIQEIREAPKEADVSKEKNTQKERGFER